MCLILESSDRFWIWLGMKCVPPDDTYSHALCTYLLKSFSQDYSHFPKQHPWGKGIFPLAVSKQGQQVPSRESESSESSNSLSAAPPSSSWWWADVTINCLSYCWSLLNTFHPQPSAAVTWGGHSLATVSESTFHTRQNTWEPSPAINATLG